VSATSSVLPSRLIRRQPRYHAPWVAGPATQKKLTNQKTWEALKEDVDASPNRM